MSRKLTTYRRPSIANLISIAPDINQLAQLREGMAVMFRAGELAPSEDTRREWHARLWARVLELMQTQPEHASYIYNVTLGWPKPAGLEAVIEEVSRRASASIPSPAERLRAQGIIIVGVTG